MSRLPRLSKNGGTRMICAVNEISNQYRRYNEQELPEAHAAPGLETHSGDDVRVLVILTDAVGDGLAGVVMERTLQPCHPAIDDDSLVDHVIRYTASSLLE